NHRPAGAAWIRLTLRLRSCQSQRRSYLLYLRPEQTAIPFSGLEPYIQSGQDHSGDRRTQDSRQLLSVEVNFQVVKNALSGGSFRNAAESALSRVIFRYGFLEVRAGEIGPHLPGEEQLGVSALPKQEVAEPLFAAGSDQQIH